MNWIPDFAISLNGFHGSVFFFSRESSISIRGYYTIQILGNVADFQHPFKVHLFLSIFVKLDVPFRFRTSHISAQ